MSAGGGDAGEPQRVVLAGVSGGAGAAAGGAAGVVIPAALLDVWHETANGLVLRRLEARRVQVGRSGDLMVLEFGPDGKECLPLVLPRAAALHLAKVIAALMEPA